jgi:hypothetical protein
MKTSGALRESRDGSSFFWGLNRYKLEKRSWRNSAAALRQTLEKIDGWMAAGMFGRFATPEHARRAGCITTPKFLIAPDYYAIARTFDAEWPYQINCRIDLSRSEMKFPAPANRFPSAHLARASPNHVLAGPTDDYTAHPSCNLELI